ncbi:hypothetical protein RRG08_013277 [Elysia crispata]|uniref:Uncharacterized protein n=1 Tax=Elysia crispata TaxID=231223 RepID=A0AAE1ED40_9GAST|nr:hypothetical protein RRG08_013277 [Elysia crispata]
MSRVDGNQLATGSAEHLLKIKLLRLTPRIRSTRHPQYVIIHNLLPRALQAAAWRANVSTLDQSGLVEADMLGTFRLSNILSCPGSRVSTHRRQTASTESLINT